MDEEKPSPVTVRDTVCPCCASVTGASAAEEVRRTDCRLSLGPIVIGISVRPPLRFTMVSFHGPPALSLAATTTVRRSDPMS